MGEAASSQRLTPSREYLVRVLTLAIDSSRLGKVSAPDTLRTLVDIEYANIVAHGAVDLQVVWELLSALPGFRFEHGRAVVAAVKSWEPRLGVAVVLPADLGHLSERDIAVFATECAVPPGPLRQLLERPAERNRRQTRLSLGTPLYNRPGAAKPSWRERRGLIAALGAITIIAVSIVALSLVEYLRGPQWERVDLRAAMGELPVQGATRLGKQVGARLASSAWLTSPEQKRTEQLASALRSLDRLGVRVLFVSDDNGRVLASAQWFGNPPQIRVVFH
jgi:hypothetical protein